LVCRRILATFPNEEVAHVKAVFHRSRPRKETDKGAVVSMRRFLMTANISPEENDL
jgi:hypothetical protein